MEKNQINQEEKIQVTKSGSADEISQLESTVNVLRMKIEKSQINKETDINLRLRILIIRINS